MGARDFQLVGQTDPVKSNTNPGYCGYVDKSGVFHQRSDCGHAKQVARDEGYQYFSGQAALDLILLKKVKPSGNSDSILPGSNTSPVGAANPPFTGVIPAPTANASFAWFPFVVLGVLAFLLLRR
jgi:hypothetical protein